MSQSRDHDWTIDTAKASGGLKASEERLGGTQRGSEGNQQTAGGPEQGDLPPEVIGNISIPGLLSAQAEEEMGKENKIYHY